MTQYEKLNPAGLMSVIQRVSHRHQHAAPNRRTCVDATHWQHLLTPARKLCFDFVSPPAPLKTDMPLQNCAKRHPRNRHTHSLMSTYVRSSR